MLILLLGAALLAATALLLSWRVAGGSVVQWLVGAYVLAFAELVVASLVLSIGSSLTRWALLGLLAAAFCVALVAARPVRLPPVGARSRLLLETLRDPPLAVLALVVVGVVGYSLALGLFSPPNDDDALEYHLARAAFWWQQHGIGYVPGAGDARIDGLPPNGEIAMTFTMVLSGSARYAPLVQLTAALATAVAVYGIARRLGLEVGAALFAGLLLVTLPVVALQSSTDLNDVVVASFVAAAAYLLLGTGGWSLALAGVAVALVVGTKLTGIVALPGLALVALLGRRPRLPALAVLAGSALVGAYWYWLNLARVHDPLGASAVTGKGVSGEGAHPDVLAALARVLRLLLAAIELPGAIGLDRLLYVAAAVVLAVLALRGAGSSRERAERAGLAAALTLAPLALVPLGHLLLRASQKVFFELGRQDVGYLDSHRSATKASPIFSWYGPLGVLLTAAACVLVVRGVRRGTLPRVALAVAVAPVLWVVLLGVGVPYWEWNGRYAMGGFALGTAAWAVAYRLRPVAWAAAAIAVLTVTLAFVHLHDRPSGLRLLAATDERSVWTEPDWAVEATDHPDIRALLRFADERIPPDAGVALEPNVWPGGLGGGLPVFPFFRLDLSRHVLFAASPREAAVAGAQWTVQRAAGLGACVPGWRRELHAGVWVVLRRETGATCA